VPFGHGHAPVSRDCFFVGILAGVGC
jgi:hypothetical protein